MKEIKMYIESNKELMKEYQKEYEKTEVESEKLRIKSNIDKVAYYIKGLQDALYYIEKEKEGNK